MPETKWAVAVTTAPRRDCTLTQCLESLSVAGWKPTVFAEPGSTLTNYPTYWNTERKLGVWNNWVNSVRVSMMNPDWDVLMTVQDDSYFHPDSKDFVERCFWPREDCGFISLYTPKHYTIRRDGEYRPVGINRIHTKSLWGACALVWPRPILELVMQHPLIEKWKGAGPWRKNKGETKEQLQKRKQSFYEKRTNDPSLIANSDTAIGKLMNRLGRSMWFVDPSPVEHIAVFSTLKKHGSNNGKRNCWRKADHSLPLDFQVPIKQTVELVCKQ